MYELKTTRVFKAEMTDNMSIASNGTRGLTASINILEPRQRWLREREFRGDADDPSLAFNVMGAAQ